MVSCNILLHFYLGCFAIFERKFQNVVTFHHFSTQNVMGGQQLMYAEALSFSHHQNGSLFLVCIETDRKKIYTEVVLCLH